MAVLDSIGGEGPPTPSHTQSGWFNRHAVIIPIARIQVVDTEAGPLEQLLKLATVTVTTASSPAPSGSPDSMRRPPRRWPPTSPSPLRGTPVTQPDPVRHPGSTAGDWHRLSAWMMLEETPGRVPQFLGVVVGLASLFLGIPGIVPIVVGALAAVVAAVPIWLATTYQVTDQHVRVRSGVIRRKAATARRDRIRSVETTASPLNRVLGLETVTIRTGADASSSAVVLYCVRKQYAIALRDYLMPTGTPAAPDTADPDSPDNGQAPDVAVPSPVSNRAGCVSRRSRTSASPSPRRLSPIGARLACEVARPTMKGQSLDLPSDLSISLTVSIAVAVIVFGAAASVLSYLFEFGHFLLSRHRDGTPEYDEACITTTSTTLDEKRIRGIRIHEPPLMRPLRGPVACHRDRCGQAAATAPDTRRKWSDASAGRCSGAGGDAAHSRRNTIPDRPGDHGKR